MIGRVWSAEEDELLRALHPTAWSFDRIADRMGINVSSVKRRAVSLGLRKGRRKFQYLSIAIDSLGVATVTVRHHGGWKDFTVDEADVSYILSLDVNLNVHAEGPKRNIFYVYTGDWRKLHRLLIGASGPILVDHKDGNGLNNRRSNLRLATSVQNTYNAKRKRPTLPFKGVWLHRHSGLWTGTIQHRSGWRQSIGYYHTPEDAAKARDKIARKLHGEFARLNFPDDPQLMEQAA